LIKTDGCSSHLSVGKDYALALSRKRENNEYYFESTICSPSEWNSLSKEDILIWEKCGNERTLKEPPIVVIDADLYPETYIFRNAEIFETLVVGIKLSTIILICSGLLLVGCITLNKKRRVRKVLISYSENKMRMMKHFLLKTRENM
jgi:hypothetical protein